MSRLVVTGRQGTICECRCVSDSRGAVVARVNGIRVVRAGRSGCLHRNCVAGKAMRRQKTKGDDQEAQQKQGKYEELPLAVLQRRERPHGSPH